MSLCGHHADVRGLYDPMFCLRAPTLARCSGAWRRMQTFQLVDRRVLRVGGADAATFLQGLVTSDVNLLATAPAANAAAPSQQAWRAAPSQYAVFLNAKGRVMHDVIISRVIAAQEGDDDDEPAAAFLVDCDAGGAPALLKMLKRYKLRAAVTLQELPIATTAIVGEEEEQAWSLWALSPASAGGGEILTHAQPQLPPLPPSGAGAWAAAAASSRKSLGTDGDAGAATKLAVAAEEAASLLAPALAEAEAAAACWVLAASEGQAGDGGDGGGVAKVTVYADPRRVVGTVPGTLPLGWRVLVPPAATAAAAAATAASALAPPAVYEARRLLAGVPQGPAEMKGALPLEMNLAELGGVSFAKGCYIGQELTARTHFKGVIRKRALPCLFTAGGHGSSSSGGDADAGNDIHAGGAGEADVAALVRASVVVSSDSEPAFGPWCGSASAVRSCPAPLIGTEVWLRSGDDDSSAAAGSRGGKRRERAAGKIVASSSALNVGLVHMRTDCARSDQLELRQAPPAAEEEEGDEVEADQCAGDEIEMPGIVPLVTDDSPALAKH